MGKFISLAVTVSVAVLLSIPVAAKADQARVRVDRGEVRLSQGGEFTAVPGTVTRANTGDRLMVADGAAATVFYDGDCRRVFELPGVYTLDGSCTAAVVDSGNMVNGTMVAAIVGGVAITAAVLSGGSDDDEAPPVSR